MCSLLTALLSAAVVAQPALVDVAHVIPLAVIDLRYATADNFVGTPLYKNASCRLVAPVADRLARVEKRLEEKGRRLVLWDCYRPLSVQREMWRRFPHKGYVKDPAEGSIHNRGAAVDVSVVALDGTPVPVPTPFDTFDPQAWADAPTSPDAAKNRALLRAAMEAENFSGNRHEWWHFAARNGRRFPLRDEPN